MSSYSSDDGFGDFLGEGEEERALLDQETRAMESRARTAGIRDGLEIGKEDTLQQGFDLGFAAAAARSHRFGVLRGALSAALVMGLLEGRSEVEKRRAGELATRLQQIAVRTAEKAAELREKNEETAQGEGDEDEKAASEARELLASVGVAVPEL